MFLDVLLDLTLSHKQIQTCQRVHVWVRVYTSWSALNLFKLALILESSVILKEINTTTTTRVVKADSRKHGRITGNLKSWRLGAYYKSDAPVPRAQMGSDASLLPIAVNFFDSQFFSYCPFE